MRIPLLFLLLSTGCAASLAQFPGPLASVGRPLDPLQAVIEGETSPTPEARPPKKSKKSTIDQRKVLAAADYYLDHAPEDFPDDCSGYVCAVYGRAGIPLRGGTRQLWEKAGDAGAIHRRKIPNIGDLVFFDNTHDRNENKKLDDELTHVAIVTAVDADGTIHMKHGGTSRGRTTLVMNLREPTVRKDGDRTINDYLRARKRRDKAGTKYLASELWRAFATVRKEDLNAWLEQNS